ncbi:hypothetical protein EDD17DRAFT_1551846, partial [Pisolithus thermaeus]
TVHSTCGISKSQQQFLVYYTSQSSRQQTKQLEVGGSANTPVRTSAVEPSIRRGSGRLGHLAEKCERWGCFREMEFSCCGLETVTILGMRNLSFSPCRAAICTIRVLYTLTSFLICKSCSQACGLGGPSTARILTSIRASRHRVASCPLLAMFSLVACGMMCAVSTIPGHRLT